ncbi:MAG: hypothetical protein K2L34_05690 [Muribaculaceae bacterium]|nr:hypothetical protein [Muribaculaceae bacterium]
MNDNRRHIHIFRKGGRHLHSNAKIWIEKNGQKSIEIAYYDLSKKENELLIEAITKHWEFLNDQITKSFKGEKVKVKDLGK